MPNVRSINQVGIRSIRNTQVMHEDSLRDGNRVVTMEEFRDRPVDSLLDGIPEGARCYISVDIDVLDMSLIPGCVSAEPNGMSYAELRDAVFAVAERTQVIGLDLVEVNPLLDVRTGLTSYLAAHIVVESLGRICDHGGETPGPNGTPRPGPAAMRRRRDGRPGQVDVHMHLYPSAESGDWWKAGYEIWEYGEKQGVRFSRSSGTVGDALAAMEKAGFSHGVAVNLLSVDLFREEALAMLPQDLHGEERAKAAAEIEATMGERFRAANRWLVDALAPIRQLTPYVGVDLGCRPSRTSSTCGRWPTGARGIKLHPVAQRFQPNDPRMRPVYDACEELGLVVLSHTGSARAASRSPSPVRSQRCSSSTLELILVLAHLGGEAGARRRNWPWRSRW